MRRLRALWLTFGGAVLATVPSYPWPRAPQALSVAFTAGAALFSAAAAARADLVEELLAKSLANKGLHDKQRLATSGANFARSRTVTDGSCAFPNNWVGCENAAESGNVKFLSDDLALECEGSTGPIWYAADSLETVLRLTLVTAPRRTPTPCRPSWACEWQEEGISSCRAEERKH